MLWLLLDKTHLKKECPATRVKGEGDKHVKTFKKEIDKGSGAKKGEKDMDGESQQISPDPVADDKKIEKPAASSGEVQALLSEATTLLKSLRPVGALFELYWEDRPAGR